LDINVLACVRVGHVPGVFYPSRIISTSSLAWARLGAGWGAFDLADMDVKSNLRRLLTLLLNASSEVFLCMLVLDEGHLRFCNAASPANQCRRPTRCFCNLKELVLVRTVPGQLLLALLAVPVLLETDSCPAFDRLNCLSSPDFTIVRQQTRNERRALRIRIEARDTAEVVSVYFALKLPTQQILGLIRSAIVAGEIVHIVVTFVRRFALEFLDRYLLRQHVSKSELLTL